MLKRRRTKDAIVHQDNIFKIKQKFDRIALNRSFAQVSELLLRDTGGSAVWAGGPGDRGRGDRSHKILRAGMQGPASAAQHSEDIFHFHF